MSGAVSRKEQANAGWFKPGRGGNPNGRPKGVGNKLNNSIKDMILTALHDVGGAQYLARQAEANPVAFMGLVGRVLPLQLANADGSNALVIDFRWADAPPTIDANVDTAIVDTAVVDTDASTDTKDTPAITFISDC